jgi:hypothetical protein
LNPAAPFSALSDLIDFCDGCELVARPAAGAPSSTEVGPLRLAALTTGDAAAEFGFEFGIFV